MDDDRQAVSVHGLRRLTWVKGMSRAFNRKLTLESKSRSDLGGGVDDVGTWSTETTVFAQIELQSSDQAFQQQQVFGVGTHIIRHRICSPIPTTDMRYAYSDPDGTRYFHVEGVLKLEELPTRGDRFGPTRQGFDILQVFVTEKKS